MSFMDLWAIIYCSMFFIRTVISERHGMYSVRLKAYSLAHKRKRESVLTGFANKADFLFHLSCAKLMAVKNVRCVLIEVWMKYIYFNQIR